jgi:small subunit ribosomal protein S17
MSETETSPQRGRRQTMIGVVVGDKMEKTVVVQVEKTVMHPLYRRYVKRRRKYYAHDESNECSLGDRVEIASSRPLSRNKRWRLTRIVEKGKGE